jgi:hypothetical protein
MPGLEAVMSYRATSLTSGSATSLAEFKPYVYGGDKPLAKEQPRKVPNPKGGTPPDSSARKKARLDKFEVALIELSGGDLEHAPAADIRKAGELVGVGDRKAREYLKELLRREVSPS